MNKKALFSQYLKNLADLALRGDAREESYYAALEHLLQQMAEATGRNDVHITTLPKLTEAGDSDFCVWNGADRIIGYIEAKRPGEEYFLPRSARPREVDPPLYGQLALPYTLPCQREHHGGPFTGSSCGSLLVCKQPPLLHECLGPVVVRGRERLPPCRGC